MIRVLIIEDEIPARKKLKRFLEELAVQTEITGEIETVAKGIAFIKSNPPDLIISDIELLDGNAFEIFKQVPVSCPIIFTTAYDRFWMDAFESNGIAYLLKPFSKDRFKKAWDKFLLLRGTAPDFHTIFNALSAIIEQNQVKQAFKSRFVINHHREFYFLNTENISFFEACGGIVFAFDTWGKKHLLTKATLKEVEEQLNASDFFRLNRSKLIHRIHIEKVERIAKNTLAVKLKGSQEYHSTSQNNTAAFRAWIDQ